MSDSSWREPIVFAFKARPIGGLGCSALCALLLASNAALALDQSDSSFEFATRVRQVIDANLDGVPERINTILVDAHGRSVGVENDVNADGIADYRVSIRRDSQGRRVLVTTDIDGDGIADAIEHWHYEGTGSRVAVDVDADGVFDIERVMRSANH